MREQTQAAILYWTSFCWLADSARRVGTRAADGGDDGRVRGVAVDGSVLVAAVLVLLMQRAAIAFAGSFVLGRVRWVHKKK